jgi:hypothetical protein
MKGKEMRTAIIVFASIAIGWMLGILHSLAWRY